MARQSDGRRQRCRWSGGRRQECGWPGGRQQGCNVDGTTVGGKGVLISHRKALNIKRTYFDICLKRVEGQLYTVTKIVQWQFIEYPRGWTCALPGHSEGRRGDRRVQDGRVAQWITRLPTEQKIPGSNPGALDYLFFFVFTRATLILYGYHLEQPGSSVYARRWQSCRWSGGRQQYYRWTDCRRQDRRWTSGRRQDCRWPVGHGQCRRWSGGLTGDDEVVDGPAVEDKAVDGSAVDSNVIDDPAVGGQIVDGPAVGCKTVDSPAIGRVTVRL